MKTSTFKDHRLNKEHKYYAKEIKALEVFNSDYLEYVNHIVFGMKKGTGMEPNDYLQGREEQIVLAVIQWLGTPVGEGFLERINK